MNVLRFFLLFLLVIPALATAQEENILTGPITVEQLIDIPDWFGEEFQTYQPEAQYLTQIPAEAEGVTIVCIFGTWCSDSRREVPRMLRLLQMTNIAPERMEMIGVDRTKQSPGGEAAPYQVDRVPTFIFFRDGKELGRIVESPFASLEKDMLGILLHPVNAEETKAPVDGE